MNVVWRLYILLIVLGKYTGSFFLPPPEGTFELTTTVRYMNIYSRLGDTASESYNHNPWCHWLTGSF